MREEPSLQETCAALRREIGEPTARDHQWQPMVSAGEIRQLLDAVEESPTNYASCPSHCCPVHGCKYGYKGCPIQQGLTHPAYPENNGCEACEHGTEPVVVEFPDSVEAPNGVVMYVCAACCSMVHEDYRDAHTRWHQR